MIVTQPDRYILQEQMSRYAPELSGDLLDIGCGGCRRYAGYFRHVKTYRTLDANAAWKPDIVGSAEHIPLPDNSVDAVLSTQVFEHLPHPQVAIAEVFRVLKHGGRCLLTVPQTNELHEEPHDYFRYTKYGLRTLFTDAGFRVDVMEQRGKYHSMLMQIRIRHFINTWKPYERRWAMWILCPLSLILTKYALWRDNRTTSPAAALHTIGWCVLATKP
ncbi:MAG: class I SAM-dependent methyltransferase [Candidatus Peribacteraceae bacterium]|nr:class I SAM-dependent methyltransferase [Candidatus Peribacteraceae bacterium]